MATHTVQGRRRCVRYNTTQRVLCGIRGGHGGCGSDGVVVVVASPQRGDTCHTRAL